MTIWNNIREVEQNMHIAYCNNLLYSCKIKWNISGPLISHEWLDCGVGFTHVWLHVETTFFECGEKHVPRLKRKTQIEFLYF